MVVKKKIIAIIQVRSNSSRLPKKVLKKINNKTLLEILVKRLSFSKTSLTFFDFPFNNVFF